MTAIMSALARADFKTLLPAVSRASTTNGTGVDLVDYEGVAAVYLDAAAAGGGTADFKLQESDDNSSWADVAAADIVGGAFTQVTTGGASLQTRYINISDRKRYIRGVVTIVTGPSVAGFELVAQKKYQN